MPLQYGCWSAEMAVQEKARFAADTAKTKWSCRDKAKPTKTKWTPGGQAGACTSVLTVQVTRRRSWHPLPWACCVSASGHAEEAAGEDPSRSWGVLRVLRARRLLPINDGDQETSHSER